MEAIFRISIGLLQGSCEVLLNSDMEGMIKVREGMAHIAGNSLPAIASQFATQNSGFAIQWLLWDDHVRLVQFAVPMWSHAG